ncbi:hypothetical protein VOI54_02520 [Tamlana sp. 2201CG12-4]|uniref:hypothetical protein n=1 Tax=Tamlana sp. 2201CG12-4 TaxID=3112582 RepID=UPI002DC03BC0|nr:hypothetical protein [Tamlana sp. 2201CG12-4]MEC3905884.1 hypothetical protein [Tamlana sp. 2201CG12-4]
MIKVLFHKITASILVLILLANNINTLAIIGDFVVNQNLITKTLCIQKDNQQGCNGKCQLTKQLAENNSDSTNKFPFQENKRTVIDVFCLFSKNDFNIGLKEPMLPQRFLIYNSPGVIKTTLKVETPPPIFS